MCAGIVKKLKIKRKRKCRYIHVVKSLNVTVDVNVIKCLIKTMMNFKKR